MQESLIDQGVSLMLYGMGTVFVFLTILVFATGLMSNIVRRLSTPEQSTPTAPDAGAGVQNTASTKISPQIIEAIKQAISEHRKR